MQIELFVYNARPDEINKLSYAAAHSTIEYNPRGLFDPLNPVFDRVTITGTANKINMCRYEWQGLTYICNCRCIFAESYSLYRIVGHIDPAATMYNIDGFRYCHFWFDRTPQSLSIPYDPLPSAQISPYIKPTKHILATVGTSSFDSTLYGVHVGGVNTTVYDALTVSEVYIIDRVALQGLINAYRNMSSDDIKLYGNAIKHISVLRISPTAAEKLQWFDDLDGVITLTANYDSATTGIQWTISQTGIHTGGTVYRIKSSQAQNIYRTYALNDDVYYNKYNYDSPIIFNYANEITCSTTLAQLGFGNLNSGGNMNVWRVQFRVYWDIYGDMIYCTPYLVGADGISTVWSEGMTASAISNKIEWYSALAQSGVKTADMVTSIGGIATSTISTVANAATGNYVGALSAGVSALSQSANFAQKLTAGGAVGQTPNGQSGANKIIVNNHVYITTYEREVSENTQAAERVTGYTANYYTEGISGVPDGVYRCNRFIFSGTSDTNGYPDEFKTELTDQMTSLWYKSTPTKTIEE